MIGYWIAMLVGVAIGYFVAAMCAAARRGDGG